MANTPRLLMPYLVAGQAQKEITHNDALNDVDALAQISVINRTTATPPSSPVEGDSYLIATSASGAWAGNANAVATYYSGWRIKTPKAGWLAYVQAEAAFYFFDGSAWNICKTVAPAHGNAFAFIGDSRLTAQFNDSGASAFPGNAAHMKTSNFFFNWANALLGQRMKVAYNGAVSGYRSDQYLANLPAAIASGAKWLMIWGVVNDITQSGTTGDTALSIWMRIRNATQTALNAGMNVILVTESGANSYSGNATMIGMNYQFNQYMREYADATQGVFCFDAANVLVDPALSTPTLRSAYSSDGTHSNAYGGYYIGAQFAALIGPFIPAFNNQIYTCAEIPSNGNIQQLANPLFLTTTGGTSGTGITGNTPANFTCQRGSGTPSATISTAADSSGYGNAVTIVGTFGAAGDSIVLSQDTVTGNYTNGDIIDCGAEIVINSGAVNLSGAYLNSNFGGISNPATDLYATNASMIALPNVAMDLTLRTVPFVLTTVGGWVTWQVKFTASGAGSFTATIKRPWMRRRFSI
ncbi:MAG: DUF2793 domain-containing protein [Alphaproteobacteria bacterium]|nr:DUF2793 domain-containing protein [Alphaproteobacteria bacterium]